MIFDPQTVVCAHAETLADCALAVVRRQFPHKLDHLILHEHDQPLPRAIHPVFYGSYDWHSSVHMHWSMLRLRVLAPALSRRADIDRHFDAHFTPELLNREREYAAQAGRGGFERPYGWAWLLKLQAEMTVQGRDDESCRRWTAALAPLAADVSQRMAQFLGRSHYPVRSGMHPNSAFAMLLSRDHAAIANDHALQSAIDGAARSWFKGDTAYPSRYEPSGADFLSAGLCEAVLMQRVLGHEFADWWASFDDSGTAMKAWLAPARVSDRTDAQLVHLDGLNLSRAWCLSELARSLPAAASPAVERAAQAHWDAAWPHVTVGDFAATHWLVSFALLSVDRRDHLAPNIR